MHLRCKDGSERMARGTMTMVGDEAIIVWTDLTEIRQSEQVLQESEQRFRNMIEQTISGIYVRRDDDELFYVLRPNSYFEATDDNPESSKVYAETQWLDFGKPGNLKALTGLDFDGLNVESVLVYVSEDGDRIGQLADTILVGSAQGGWTYSGGVLPVDAAGTEFKLRFVGDANLEVQVNRLTIYFDDLGTS
mgnify:CR=1 FL=1